MLNKLLDLPHKYLFPLYFFFYVFFLQNIVDSYMNYYYLKYFDNILLMLLAEFLVLMVIYIVILLGSVLLAYTLKLIYNILFKHSSASNTKLRKGSDEIAN